MNKTRNEGAPEKMGEIEEMASKGDAEALVKFVEKHRAKLRQIVQNIVTSHHDTDDIMAEGTVELFKHIREDKYDPKKGSLLVWASAVFRHRSIDLLRKRNRRIIRTEQYRVEVEHDSRHHVDQNLERRDLLRKLESLIYKLPEPQQYAIALTYFKGMSDSAIAALTKTRLGTIKARIRRGIKRLRELGPSIGLQHEL